MKVVILCGGQGTRIRDVSEVLPKPMLPIGDRPILWHIMKTYSKYGLNDFVLCLGYKGWVIKEFFLNYFAKTSDLTVNLGIKDSVVYHHLSEDESNWKVTLADTGETSQTATRLWKIQDYLKDDDLFCVTYGDGVADVDIKKLLEFHKKSGAAVTITGVQPSGRFGEIESHGDFITEFNEKPNVTTGMINGGFMVFKKEVFKKYFDPQKDQSLESDVLPKIVKDKKVAVYRHSGLWQCIDTAREYNLLNKMWDEKKAFWKTW